MKKTVRIRKIIKKDRSKARGWLAERSISLVNIQRAIGHRQLTQTSETVNGWRNSRAVLSYLLDLGCPAEYLDLPDDMREAAA